MSNFYIHKYGRFADVDTAGEDVWDLGSNYLFPLVAFQTEVAGGASDIPSSDGIHSIQVEGLDINGAEITEVATLNGATPVVLANSYYRVNRAFTKANGGLNAGINSFNIVVSHTGSATLSRISAGAGQTLQAVYTLPAAVKGHLKDWTATVGRFTSRGDVAGTLSFQTRENGESWRTRDTLEVVDGQFYDHRYESPGAIPIKAFSDIRVRVTATNTDSWAVSAAFEIEGFRDIR